MSNDFRSWGVPSAERFLIKRSFRQLLLMPERSPNVAARCGLEFKLQLVRLKEHNLKVNI
jgi:hypothetical protein